MTPGTAGGTSVGLLLVENLNADARQILSCLAEAGVAVRVTRADTEAEFLAALDAGPDLILCDFAPAAFSGVDALRHANRRRPDVPFIFIGGGPGDAATSVLKLGANDFVAKQHLEQLGPAVLKAMDSAAARRQMRGEPGGEGQGGHVSPEHERARLAAIVDGSDDAIISKSLEGIVLTWNRAATRIFGYEPREIIGGPIDVLIPPERRDEERAILSRLRRGERVEHFETVRARKDGRLIDVSITVSPIRDVAGNVVGASKIARDITDRRRSNEALARAARVLEVAQKASRIGTFEWDVVTDRNEWSEALEALYGLAPGAFSGSYEAWRRLVHPDDLADAETHLRESLVTGQFDAEWRVVWPDGTIRWLAARAVVFREAGGKPLRMVGVNIDITDRKAIEQELARAKDAAEAANRSKDQFISVLSHELRTPLSPIISNVQLLETEPGLSEEVRRGLSVIRRNAELEARLIDDLLDLTRIARGKLQLHLQPTDVHMLVENTLDICRSEMRSKRIDLKVDLAASHPVVRGDTARLQQVLWNLTSNAVKFTPTGGSIRLRTYNATMPPPRIKPAGEPPAGAADRPGVMIEVRDTGVGIAPEALPRIFSAFEQADDSITREFGGLGLGLAIARALVEGHGGTLAAASEGSGCGATFTVALPASIVSPEPASPRSGHGGTQRPLRILLVEDHDDTSRVMSRLLRRGGHDVQVAVNVQSALELIGTSSFDMLISDIGLPDGTGLDVVRHLKPRHPVPAIALTGFGMDQDVARSRAAGFDEHLTKPVNFEKLEAVIRNLSSAALQT